MFVSLKSSCALSQFLYKKRSMLDAHSVGLHFDIVSRRRQIFAQYIVYVTQRLITEPMLTTTLHTRPPKTHRRATSRAQKALEVALECSVPCPALLEVALWVARLHLAPKHPPNPLQSSRTAMNAKGSHPGPQPDEPPKTRIWPKIS